MADPIHSIPRGSEHMEISLGLLLARHIASKSSLPVHKARHFVKSRNTFAKEKNTVKMSVGKRKCNNRSSHAAKFHS